MEQLKPREQVTLKPNERDHACVVDAYRSGAQEAKGCCLVASFLIDVVRFFSEEVTYFLLKALPMLL